jgi:uncharacterized damage-inducible protein DinB
MNEPPIAREEVIAQLFNVSDIVASLARIDGSWETTMAKKKLTKAEREEMRRERERALENARRTRELAERAQAELDAQASRD